MSIKEDLQKIFESSPNSNVTCNMVYSIRFMGKSLATIYEIDKLVEYTQYAGTGTRMQELAAYLKKNGIKTRLEYEEEITKPKPKDCSNK